MGRTSWMACGRAVTVVEDTRRRPTDAMSWPCGHDPYGGGRPPGWVGGPTGRRYSFRARLARRVGVLPAGPWLRCPGSPVRVRS